MDLGGKIEKLRKQRQIPVAKLSQGILSESNYSRFSRGKTMVAANVFIDVLKNLEADFYEISEFNHNPRVVDKYKAQYLELLKEEDFVGLKRLGKMVAHLSKFRFDTYNNLAISIEVQLAKHENRPIDSDIYQLVKNHLTSVETWSYQETLLFDILVESFDSQMIMMMIENFTKKNQDYMVAERNTHIIAILFTAFMAFLERGEVVLATATLEMMQPYLVVVGLTIHKFYYALAKMLLDVIEAPTEVNIDKIVRLHDLCLSLGNKSHSYKVHSNYELLREIYNLPEIWDSE